MSATAPDEDCAEHLVNLIINQDHVAQKWLQFLITIEAGLVVALSFILQPSRGSRPPGWLIGSGLVLIPVLGIAVAIFLAWIVVRERKWQAYYVGRYNSLPAYAGKVFPHGKSARGGPGTQPVGMISTIVMSLAVVIVLGWMWLLLALSCGQHAG